MAKRSKLKFVTIEKDGEQGKCLPQSVAAWERNGWTVVDDGDSEDAENVPFHAADSDAAEHHDQDVEPAQEFSYNPDDHQDEE